MDSKRRIAGIIIENGKILMLRGRGYPELWTPGGKIDTGESDKECLSRGLQEELGVELVKANFFKEYSGPSFYHPDVTINQKVYIAKIKGNPTPNAEIDNLVWLTKSDFEKRLFPMIDVTEKEIIPDLIKEGAWV